MRGAKRGMGAVDLVRDVLIEVSARRGRAVLMILAVAFSIGALVSSVEISTTASRQIGDDIAASTIDVVTVEDAYIATDSIVEATFPLDAETRVRRLEGVVAAGLRLNDSRAKVARSLPGTAAAWDKGVVGVGPGYLAVVEAATFSGRQDRLGGAERVAILGVDAAAAFDIPVTADPTGFALRIDNVTYQVIDFVRDGGRVDLDATVLLPYDTVVDRQGSDSGAVLSIRTAPGAGAPVSRVVATAVRPDAPQRLKVSDVVSVEQLRVGVDTQLGRLAAGIGAFLLVLTCLLIANSMIVSVVSRTGEIGLRRALGVSRSGVAAVFWCEGAVIGGMGGLTGSALAMVASTAVALVNGWTVAVDWGAYVAGPAIGVLVGFAASAYPAARAARISPAVAVRSD